MLKATQLVPTNRIVTQDRHHLTSVVLLAGIARSTACVRRPTFQAIRVADHLWTTGGNTTTMESAAIDVVAEALRLPTKIVAEEAQGMMTTTAIIRGNAAPIVVDLDPAALVGIDVIADANASREMIRAHENEIGPEIGPFVIGLDLLVIARETVLAIDPEIDTIATLGVAVESVDLVDPGIRAVAVRATVAETAVA